MMTHLSLFSGIGGEEGGLIMKYFSEITRQRMSESAKRRCNAEWRKRQSALRETSLDTEKVRSMYESGMTQVEIAKALGVTQK